MAGELIVASCAGCRFRHSYPEDRVKLAIGEVLVSQLHQCRRFPPQPQPDDEEGHRIRWPRVWPEEWCGGFEPARPIEGDA